MRKIGTLVLALLAAALVLVVWVPQRGVEPEVPVVPPDQVEGNLPVGALGLNIPWAVGGERIERSGSRNMFAGEWPNVSFRGLRLWDTRTAWLNLEPAPGQWNFDQSDSLVQKAADNGISDVIFTLGGTPTWAASKIAPADAPWMGPGSASMPSDLDAWRNYVDTVAKRYAGRVTSYEIGNEPNLQTFWSGTPDEYRQYVVTAASAIRNADPNATIVVNSALVRSAKDIKALSTWMSPLNAARDLIDVVSIHFYPEATRLDDFAELMEDAKEELANAGWADSPKWITEVNVRNGAKMDPADQRSAVFTLSQQMLDAEFERAYWYAWTDLGPEDLIQFQPLTAGSTALAALS